MIPNWILSLSHLIFLSLIIYLWKSNSKPKDRIASLLIFTGCLWGLHWIFISLNEYGGLNFLLASFATVLLATYVASYYLIAGVIVKKLGLGPLSIASIVCLMEWIKSNLLTGFPWLNIGVLQIDSIFSVFAPIFGSFGVSFATVYFAALISHSTKYALIVATSICFIALMLNNFVHFTEPSGEKLNVVLIQGAIPQKLKFDPVHKQNTENKHLELITAAIKVNPETKLIVLPETAFTSTFNNIEPLILLKLREQLSQNDIVLMTGIPQKIDGNWRNSLIAMKSDNLLGLEVFDSYDKHHLVPFGEFIPWGFKWFVNMMQIPLGEFEEGKFPQAPIKVQDQYIGVNICFEDLFGDEISKIFFQKSHAEKPSILLNISNLAWFGNTNALDYHLKASRMRSMETGRPMLRATNTGITAAIDHKGIVIKKLPSADEGFLITKIQGTNGQTLYNFFGDYLILVFSLIILILNFFLKKKISES